MEKDARVCVIGHTGLLGSAIAGNLKRRGYINIITRTRPEMNLGNLMDVSDFFRSNRPDFVFMAGARVGSIAENISYPVEFLSENLLVQDNVLAEADFWRVKKLIFFSSNCCYPRDCPQPIREEYLMTGPLEPTNEAYALAKIVGMKLCQSYNIQYRDRFYCAVLASLYGPNDHFGTERAHVIADMIHKFHNAKEDGIEELTFWGDGSPLREFMYVDDAADAAIFLMDNFNPSVEDNKAGRIFLNAGTGEEISIADLARLIAGIVGYEGRINWDISKPNGMPRKLLDSSKCYALGWRPKTPLEEGIRKTYLWYLENRGSN